MNTDPLNQNDFWSQLAPVQNPLAPPPVPMGPGAAPQPAPPASTPAPPAAAPAPPQSSDMQTVDSILAELKKNDPNKDPEYQKAQAARDKARAAQEKYTQEQIADIEAFRALSDKPPAPPVREHAPEMRDFAVQGMPFLMVLTAIGGKVAKLSGMNMLGAMQGMLKGSLTGQDKMFNEAYQNWQENWKRAQEDWRNRMTVYEANLKWREGKINASGAAAQAERELGGAYGEDMRQIIGFHQAQDKAMISLKALDTKLALQKQAMDDRKQKVTDDIITKLQKAAAAFPRLQAAQVDAERALKLLPGVLEKYKNDTENGPNSLVPKTFAEFLTATGDTEVQQFASLLKSAKPILAALETSGTGSRSNMLLQTMIAETVPTGVFNLGPAQVDQLTRDAAGILKTSLDQQRQNIDVWRQQYQGYTGQQYPEQPGYSIPPTELPSAKPAAPAAGDGGWGKATVVNP